MPEDRDDKNSIGEVQVETGGDSSSEMEIISSVFGDEKPAEANDQVFSMDLFADPAPAAAVEPESSAPAAQPGPDNILSDVPAEVSEPGPEPEPQPESEAAAADEDVQVESPAPEESEPEAPHASSIKIVTDDDLRKLFEASSPGYPREETGPEDEVPAEEKEAALAAREEIDDNEESTFTGEAPKVMEEIGDEISEFENIARDTGLMSDLSEHEELGADDDAMMGGSTSALDDISPDEIVDQIETSAVVGEMTAVAAGKKGEMLEKTRDLIGSLEPASGDYMNIDELTKLFNNVNVLIDLVQQLAGRIDELEDRLEALEGPGQ